MMLPARKSSEFSGVTSPEHMTYYLVLRSNAGEVCGSAGELGSATGGSIVQPATTGGRMQAGNDRRKNENYALYILPRVSNHV